MTGNRLTAGVRVWERNELIRPGVFFGDGYPTDSERIVFAQQFVLEMGLTGTERLLARLHDTRRRKYE